MDNYFVLITCTELCFYIISYNLTTRARCVFALLVLFDNAIGTKANIYYIRM